MTRIGATAIFCLLVCSIACIEVRGFRNQQIRGDSRAKQIELISQADMGENSAELESLFKSKTELVYYGTQVVAGINRLYIFKNEEVYYCIRVSTFLNGKSEVRAVIKSSALKDSLKLCKAEAISYEI